MPNADQHHPSQLLTVYLEATGTPTFDPFDDADVAAFADWCGDNAVHPDELLAAWGGPRRFAAAAAGAPSDRPAAVLPFTPRAAR